MLSKADDYPIHQTPEPIAYAGTDRNFYDRYFFNGYEPDLSSFFAVAFGVYPHLNVADAHFSTIRDGVQHNVHASRELHMERLDLTVGPIAIEVLQPLQRLRVTVAETDGISAELECTGRAFPIEEPRFVRRDGPRSRFDYTRLTQNVRWTGWIEVDGVRTELSGDAAGTRDRSWGLRPIGARDRQPTLPEQTPQFYWLWTPVNFAGRSVFFHVNDDEHGEPWNRRAVLCPDGAAQGEAVETEQARAHVDFAPGTRFPRSGRVEIEPPGAAPLTMEFAPEALFQMRGLGYQHRKWGHGNYVGALEVEREDIVLADVDPRDPLQLHVQALSRVTLEQDGDRQEGAGVFECFALGPYAPYGLTGLADPT